MNYFQICARCATRIDVGPRPQQWCPVCRGVLLSPVPVGQVPTGVRRNFRWVASSPVRARRSRVVRAPSPTPRYDMMPTWGLPVVGRATVEPTESAGDRLAGRVTSMVSVAFFLFVAAALAEFARYAVLLVSRDSLIPAAVLALSDAAVWCLSFLSVGVGLVAAVASVAWLVRARRSAYADRGEVDPRRPRTLFAGSLIPLVNLVAPGVFLTELARVSSQRWSLERVLPWWWTAWVVNWLMLAATLAFRVADGIQARANGVLATALTDLVAAGLAALTLVLIRRSDGRTVRGDDRTLTRWTIAPDPVELTR
ncbi:DUF4328 domain-containing protein [Rhodococcus sp. MEB064]|uniref:DUF4328 domain-containing protein n=1 Tax=Rhodococcus sp. MEB064 TaxID=1587522 RepID=UPI0005AD0456|nr:DUF4328 domain-containing protein [Rhodococcus sp. MEB064]